MSVRDVLAIGKSGTFPKRPNQSRPKKAGLTLIHLGLAHSVSRHVVLVRWAKLGGSRRCGHICRGERVSCCVQAAGELQPLRDQHVVVLLHPLVVPRTVVWLTSTSCKVVCCITVSFQQVLPQGNDGAYLRERTQLRMRKRKNANVDMHNTGTNGRGETKQAGAADLLIIEG